MAKEKEHPAVKAYEADKAERAKLTEKALKRMQE